MAMLCYCMRRAAIPHSHRWRRRRQTVRALAYTDEDVSGFAEQRCPFRAEQGTLSVTGPPLPRRFDSFSTKMAVGYGLFVAVLCGMVMVVRRLGCRCMFS